MAASQHVAERVVTYFRGGGGLPSLIEIRATPSATTPLAQAPWRLVDRNGGQAALVESILQHVAANFAAPGQGVRITVDSDTGTILSCP